MSVVFDMHVHCFPPLGEDNGYMAERLALHQYGARYHSQAIRRTRDNATIDKPLLAAEKDGISWQPQVDFRIGRFGRVEFTHEGEDYYYQWMPPTMWDMSSPPEYIIAQMDFAGVDRAMIQHEISYGALDDYLADCVRRYPDRLTALAQVQEWRGGEPDQLERVKRQIQELGFCGLWFNTTGFFMTDFEIDLNSPSLEPLWDLVGELGVPIYFCPATRRQPIIDVYLEEHRELARWAEKYPHIPGVLSHGMSHIVYDESSISTKWSSSSISTGAKLDRFSVPQEVLTLLKKPNWYMEVMLHLMQPDSEFPPYSPDLREVVRVLREEVGAHKLMWGSDMPCSDRTVTYKQSMIFFQTQCDFLTTEERNGILGDNLVKLHNFSE